MNKISLVLTTEDERCDKNIYLVRKDCHNDVCYYGFWEIDIKGDLACIDDMNILATSFFDTYGFKANDLEFLTKITNNEINYLFYRALTINPYKDDSFSSFCEFDMVDDKQLAQLDIIYPDAMCRDHILGIKKSASEKEKEILIAADRIFSIRESAARADAFIALMDYRISACEFEEYIKLRMEQYSYGLPGFGFSDDEKRSLHIWKRE